MNDCAAWTVAVVIAGLIACIVFAATTLGGIDVEITVAAAELLIIVVAGSPGF